MVPRCPGTDTQRLSLIATEEMERFRTQYFSKPADLEKSFKKICGLSDDAGIGAITIDELTIAMENLGFALSEDKDEAEEEVFEMIGEPSMVMSMTPPQVRISRRPLSRGNSATEAETTSSTVGQVPRWE